MFAGICQLLALSPDGRCKSFDSSADGYGRGEGCAVFLLTKHNPSTRTGLQVIYAGSTTNQGGKSSALTAPSGNAQSQLIQRALRITGIPAERVESVSVHGTGTSLGDPIEVNALGSALRYAPGGESTVSLMSNKSCYGHTEGVAGVTGMNLSVASLIYSSAPGCVNLRSLNPLVGQSLSGWHRQGAPTASTGRQLAGVCSETAGLASGTSSFGMSGVNAHALLHADSRSTSSSLLDKVRTHQHAKLVFEPLAFIQNCACQIVDF